MKALVVTIPFADYEAGDMITDSAEMKKALANSPQHVVPVKHTESDSKAKADSKAEPAKSGTPTAPSSTPSSVKPT